MLGEKAQESRVFNFWATVGSPTVKSTFSYDVPPLTGIFNAPSLGSMDLEIRGTASMANSANPRSNQGPGYHNRSQLHLARKIWHATTVSIMAATFAWAPNEISFWLLGIFLVLSSLVDFLRQRSPTLNQRMLYLFRYFIRENEVHSWAGTTFLLLGVTLSVVFFHPAITLLSLLFLAFADPLASFVGIQFGRTKIFGHKSLEGAFGAFLVCALISALFFVHQQIYTDRLLLTTVLCGIAGSLSELIPIGKLDDNLSFPVLSSFFLWGIFSVMNLWSAFPLPL